MGSEEESLERRLQELQKQLGKKQMFEEAVSSIRSLLRDTYRSASPSLQKLIYSAVCRVATVLQTRYTAPGFWLAGLGLFEEAERLIPESSVREHLKTCIARAREQLYEMENQPEISESARSRTQRGFLFEGHLTVDPEPPQPALFDLENFLAIAAASSISSEGQAVNNNISESPFNIQDFMLGLEDFIENAWEGHNARPRRPPASKKVIADLPVITVTEEFLAKLGRDIECSICKDNLVINDKMQELPCKHIYHPPCIKTWLDESNYCPVCRHELQTDDHAYESWKEREKEAEEQRKGAANAIRGGEYMYV
ncbi:hypothetical protein HHK36_021939 [Tetracentron sinense]|uniref:RING-type E3 ubiquitin transferase n=1 Tax=Tetracentron sinense TaxID=13715 RepID=A0A835DAF7_TETSI|nr:hypothetical protein HHK36_021939 [Tetracentron sinense]